MSPAPDRILREVQPTEAFYFFAEVGRPTGISATSLDDFITKLKSVEIQSVEFHTNRGDFEKWVQMLGDATLSGELARVRQDGSAHQDLRKRTVDVLEARYNELIRPSGRQNQRPKARTSPGR